MTLTADELVLENEELRKALRAALEVMRLCETGSDFWDDDGIGGNAMRQAKELISEPLE